MRWQVHKFGGSSLADPGCIGQVGRQLLARDEPAQAVVVSAMAGVTDALIGLAEASAAGDGWIEGLEALERRHLQCAEALQIPDAGREALVQSFVRLRRLLDALALLGSLPVEARDLVSGLGELWCARLLAGWFAAQGAPASFLDARDVLRVDLTEPGPVLRADDSRHRLRHWLEEVRPARIVMTGFICRDASGRVTTLGRNGSDYSATMLAALLDAAEVTIWTDVDGVLSADPRRVPHASPIPRLSYREAFELAYFGARVLHPQTMLPVLARGIPVRIRSTQRPDAPGTRIDPEGATEPPVKGVSGIDQRALVNIEGAGMLGVPGTAERVFRTLHRLGISVQMISQGSSEHSICVVVGRSEAETAREALESEFAREIAHGLIQGVTTDPHIEVLAIVGDGMAGVPGIAGRMLRALGRAGVNVRAIAQGSSERNLSVAVDATQGTRALRAVHSAFWLSEQTLAIGVIGTGKVGRALLTQIAAARPRLLHESGIDLRLRAVADSRSMRLLQSPDEMNPGHADWSAWPATPLDIERFTAHVHADHLPHAVIVDCTASARIADHYAGWLAAGIHVVTPNKQAGSGPLDRYRALKAQVAEGRAHWRYEATVGAGLPVVQTLKDLIDTGDELLSIEGILSGTLSWLFNRMDSGADFAELVREAHACGYTEPDPRDDLSGLDVARKLVILAREAGLPLELDQVQVEALMPDSAATGRLEDFWDALGSLNETIVRRAQAARRAGRRLRYLARLDVDGCARVALEEVADDHPAAGLALTDNLVCFRTHRYAENPLIVRGPGAGPEVTAAGVFADLLRIAATLGGRA
ncbi:MAG: bifunctional aspartate kinase/homoserine dehydrogenase I [Wenzhouxiangellaceae bacterium]